MNLTMLPHDLPVRLRFEEPVTDAHLMEFSRANNPLRVEREANGEYIVMSPTTSAGGSLEAEVLADLTVWARVDGRGKAFGPSAGFTLGDTSVRAPDASWVSLRCWNALTEAQHHSYSPLCPEFVLEIRSKTDRLKPLQEKMRMWVANGAELAWLIDPERRVVEVYRPGEEPEIHENPTSCRVPGRWPALSWCSAASGAEFLTISRWLLNF